jgi:DNA recombination protein RmuC
MEIALAVSVALVLGGLAGWLLRGVFFRSSTSAYQARLADVERQRAEKAQELEALKASHGQDQAKLMAALQSQASAEAVAQRVPDLESRLAEAGRIQMESTAKLAEAETALREERDTATEKIALLTQAQTSLSDAFKALSSEALKSNNQAFMDLAKTTLEKFQEGARTDLDSRQKAVDALIKPIQDSLQKVDGKLGEIEKSRLQTYAALDEQLKGLVNTHLPTLHRETANLVKALRQPTVRGRWGEIQLQRVVEMAGMVEHCDFTQQESLSTEEGRLRPDLTVRLPGGKRVVVDAKAPVSAYLDAIETEDEAARSVLLADHARQVRTHISQLSRKAYWEQFDQAPEFVILFLPGEMFFSAALQQDPTLIEFGVNEKVIPATPTTLIALLRAVSYGWRQEALAQNAQEISDLGRELFKRIGDLAGHWSDVGKHLGKSLDAFNKATGTLESRVLVSARRFKELKAAPEGVDLEPLEMLDRAPRKLQAGEFAAKEKAGSGA